MWEERNNFSHNYFIGGSRMADENTNSLREIMVFVDQVKVGSRVRKEFGDMRVLADNIKQYGLLQPIGVTKDYELVFGQRRLMACKDLLWWTQIPARIIDIQEIAYGEFYENEMRKEFTPSERVAILAKIEALPENKLKRGRKPKTENVDLDPGIISVNKNNKIQELTAEINAKKAGFDGRKQAAAAKKVVESGDEEVIEDMDKGKISITKAAKKVTPPKQPKLKPGRKSENVSVPISPKRAAKLLAEVFGSKLKELIHELQEIEKQIMD
jgi:ParB-like chromosome segregation protein Spo0J